MCWVCLTAFLDFPLEDFISLGIVASSDGKPVVPCAFYERLNWSQLVVASSSWSVDGNLGANPISPISDAAPFCPPASRQKQIMIRHRHQHIFLSGSSSACRLPLLPHRILFRRTGWVGRLVGLGWDVAKGAWNLWQDLPKSRHIFQHFLLRCRLSSSSVEPTDAWDFVVNWISILGFRHFPTWASWTFGFCLSNPGIKFNYACRFISANPRLTPVSTWHLHGHAFKASFFHSFSTQVLRLPLTWLAIDPAKGKNTHTHWMRGDDLSGIQMFCVSLAHKQVPAHRVFWGNQFQSQPTSQEIWLPFVAWIFSS